MAQRRLQRRCETKGRRLKTTPCTWSGSFMTSYVILGKEASTRPSTCAGSGLHVLLILSIVFTVFLFVFVSFHLISIASTMLGCMCRSLAMFSAGCRHLQVDAMFGYHGRRKKAQSVVRIISSNQRNPRNPKLAKSMKSGLIERAHCVNAESFRFSLCQRKNLLDA